MPQQFDEEYLPSSSSVNSRAPEVSGSILNRLLAQVANMVISNYNKTSSDVQLNNEPMSVAFSFTSHFVKKICFTGSEKALWYLSLPVTEYSVLDKNLVQKSKECDDLFHLKIPLDDFARGMNAIFPIGGYHTLMKYQLSTDITVDSHPSEGVINMRSGPFTFIPNLNFVLDGDYGNSHNQTSFYNQSIVEAQISSPISAGNIMQNSSDEFPTWLEWGDKDSIEYMNITNSLGSVVSSLQPGISINWKWSKKQNFGKRMSGIALGKWKNIFRSNANTVYPQNEKNDTDELITKLKVEVRLDMNIPMSQRLGRTISLLPVKMLLQHAGSIIISTFLRNLVPYFEKKLMKDFENRIYFPT